jgi:hypothetical protein
MGQCITGGGMNCIKAGMLMNGAPRLLPPF